MIDGLTLPDPDHTWSATADDATSVLPRTNTTTKVADGPTALTRRTRYVGSGP